MRRPLRSPRQLALVVIGAALLAASAWALAETPSRELKLSVAAGPAVPLGRAAQRWSELLARADRSATLALYPGAVLAQRDPLRELKSLIDGDADAAVGSALAWSMQVPALLVYALPWIAPNRGALNAIVADRDLRTRIAARLDENGVVLLALAPLGYRDVATVSHPVRECGDFTGLRLRVLPHPMLLDLYSKLGGSASAMTFAAAQTAFAEGKLDGEEAPPASLAAARVAGVRYVAVPGGVGDAMLFAIRRETWSSLDETQRQALARSADQAAREIGGAEADEAALVDLRRQGITVLRFGSAQTERCRAAAQPVFDKWANPVGPDIVEQAQAAAARRR